MNPPTEILRCIRNLKSLYENLEIEKIETIMGVLRADCTMAEYRRGSEE